MSESNVPVIVASDENATNGKNPKLDTEKIDIGPHLFAPKEVLKSGRMASVLGQVDGSPSILLLEQNDFTPSNLLSEAYSGHELSYEQIFNNDIYSRYIIYPKSPYNGIKTTLVSPCTQKHIDKYRRHTSHLILETPVHYQNITLPHLLSDQFTLQWVYNILTGDKEAERVVYRDNNDEEWGFVLLPDLHWDGKDPDSLHLLALPFKHGILSIRSLNSTHLPLLNNIREKSLKIIEQKYGLKSDRLRMYFHYQPTFYHLHVHITHLECDAPGIFVEKSHLLETVINNIELVPDYYQRCTLPFTLRETDSLFSKYKEAGLIKSIEPVPDNLPVDSSG